MPLIPRNVVSFFREDTVARIIYKVNPTDAIAFNYLDFSFAINNSLFVMSPYQNAVSRSVVNSMVYTNVNGVIRKLIFTNYSGLPN